MKVCAVIVFYNGRKWIDRCLGALRNSVFPVTTIAVNNLSPDDSAAYIEEKFPNVIVVEAGANLGFGKGNNLGIRKAVQENADYIFLLNQDAWVKEDTIGKLVEVAGNYPEYGIISPFHLDSTETQFERLFLELFDRYNPSLIQDMYFNRLHSIYETSYIHAASWFITRKCIETTGGFDPLFFQYGEDDDYLQRTKYFKFKIGLVPSAKVVHDAAYSGWEKFEWNENRNLVIAFNDLKRMSPHFRTNVLLFIKAGFDELTTLLLLRKFKKFRFRFSIIIKAILKLRKIHRSYKSSFTKGAFL